MKNGRPLFRMSVRWTVALTLLVLMAACRPDEERHRRPNVLEGQDATVTLKWTMPAMAERQFELCTPLPEERARQIEDLWVGIYNANTGACTANYLLDSAFTNAEHTGKTLGPIKTESGESYIVAVANVRRNFGFSEMAGENEKPGDTVPLAALLKKADTWDKYKAITVVWPEVGEVHPQGLIAMAGSYLAGGVDAKPAGGWSDAEGNPAKVIIKPGATKLDGYIHLRRLYAFNRFTIKSHKFIKMRVENWQVFQLPVMSHLQERATRNAADISDYFAASDAPEGYRRNYVASPNTSIFEKDSPEGEYVFDFYQFENRHTGLDWVSGYNDRDKEWKTGDDPSHVTNTGVYRSLCPDDRTPTTGKNGVNTNNFATYVKFRVNLSYYAANSGFDADPVALPDAAEPPAGAVLRSGYADYVVHLGYCEGDDLAEKAKDFNVRRNNWYEYTVTINGLNKIGLEATSGEDANEVQPGAEGDVFDNTKTIVLDAHNAVFNIQMTNNQRTRLQWVLSVPGANPDKMDYLDYPDGETQALRENQYYNWIRFKPTPKQDLLAIYKESATESDEDLWTLEDFCKVDGHRGIDAKGKEDNNDINDATTAYWYTVFVKEYTYEDAGNPEIWKTYVNQADRVAYLNTQVQVSADGHSKYMQPEYTIVQRSIQSYYNLNASGLQTAMGVERENETYGLNMRWSTAASTPSAGWNPNNGRWNEWQYANGKKWRGGILPSGEKIGNHYYLPAASTPAITRQNEKKLAGSYSVYALQPLSSGGYKSNEYDPNGSSEFYEMMASCLNRNRDENGNNQIDAAEMKWYLASSGQYLRMVLGRESLEAPLMDFDANATLTYPDCPTRFHYAASDFKVIWAEEGVSTGDMAYNGEEKNRIVWQTRCVRDLGVDMSAVPEQNPVQVAYRHDESNRRILFNYYDDASLRQMTTKMPVHTIGDLANRASRYLEYASKDVSNVLPASGTGLGVDANGVLSYYENGTRQRQASEADFRSGWAQVVNDNTICGQYEEISDPGIDKGTWRVPNQVELVVMSRFGFLTSGGVLWLSGTQSFYPNSDNVQRFIAYFYDNVTLWYGYTPKIRCVRDVAQ